MENAIKADKIASEIIELICKNKDEIDYTNFSGINDLALNNKYYNQLKSDICNEKQYPDLKNIDTEFEANILRHELRNMKRSKFCKTKKFYIATSAVVAAIVCGVLLFNNNKTLYTSSEEYNIVTSKVVGDINNDAIIILGDGSNINIGNIENNNKIKDIIKVSNEKAISYNVVDNNVARANEYNTAITPSMRTLKIELSDGTIVTLNANSKLIYPVNFSDEDRVVFLEGEAYFNVEKSIKQFVVETDYLSVNVYGTEFNVNTSCRSKVETVLVSGSVGVEDKNGRISLMKASQGCFYDIVKDEYKVEDVDVDNYISWIKNQFKYKDIYIEYLLSVISEWYGVDFVIKDDISNIKVNIWTNRDDSIISLLSSIERSTGLFFVRESQNKYNVKLKKNRLME